MPVEGAGAPGERVTIVYSAATGDGYEEKELPLKLLLLGDFAGRPDPTPLEEREPIPVDRDSFDDVLASQRLRLELTVPDHLGDGGGDLPVTLRIGALRDFAPDAIARQVPELSQLLDLREGIAALKATLGERPAFAAGIAAVLADPAARAALRAELGSA